MLSEVSVVCPFRLKSLLNEIKYVQYVKYVQYLSTFKLNSRLSYQLYSTYSNLMATLLKLFGGRKINRIVQC